MRCVSVNVTDGPRPDRRVGIAISMILCSAVIAVAFLVQPALAVEHLRVEEGKSIVLRYPEKIETVSLADDKTADVAAITATELVIIGKQTGTTSLVVWGESQEHTAYEIKVVRSFSGMQILLEVQIGEVNKSAFDGLGFDFLWDNTDLTEGATKLGTYGGGVQTPSIPNLLVGEGVTGLFTFRGRENDVQAIVHALEERGTLKLLATPKLLSLSGEKASFLSGGEIPIPISQSATSGAAATITVEWKEYGVRLNFTPTVIDSDLVNLVLESEVSSLDFTSGVVIGGFTIPALITRRAKTTVELHSGEAMFLGGLVATETVVTRRRVPILGHIPLLGALFTKKDSSTRETELVIIVSPRIVGRASEEAVPPLPWDGPESEADETDVETHEEGRDAETGGNQP